MHHIDAQVARARDTHQRIHIRAVHVNQRALVMQDGADLLDVLFEHTYRIGVGDHQPGHVFSRCSFENGEIDYTAVVRLDILHRVANHRRSRRVGPMRRVRHQDLFPRITALLPAARGS